MEEGVYYWYFGPVRGWTMFSQLCRAKPSALWNKFGARQTENNNESQRPRPNDCDTNGEDRCQLEHCTFCDFRVCCQVTSCDSNTWENECLQETDSNAHVTENPAYGLSSKNWLEVKEGQDGEDAPGSVNMEELQTTEQDTSSINSDESSITSDPYCINPSQKDKDCDENTVPKMNQVNFQSHFQQNKMELKTRQTEDISETPKHELSCSDLKQGKFSWSVLRHRQLSGDILKHCDNKLSNVIEHPNNDRNHQVVSQDRSNDSSNVLHTKKNIKDRAFPLSLVRSNAKMNDKKTEPTLQQFNVSKNDLTRQRPVHRNARERIQTNFKREAENSKRISNDILGLNNPLSDIEQIKTEESIQEWLARIGESTNKTWPSEYEDDDPKQETQQSAWCSVNNTDEEKNRDNTKLRVSNFRPETDKIMLHKKSNNSSEITLEREKLCHDDSTPKTEDLDTTNVLCNASKASPANIPMVVMQCSRLHSHIGCKPPFQQTSLPMGTLVTALYQESDWLYVQTPHGVEGFVSSANCVAIGTVNDPAQSSRRPWEPCDFPIQISLRKKHEFGRQQGSYISAKLPTNNCKQAAPYVSTVKMKTNFYSDRYFSHTFKSKDSIKTAKTVTDILRSSPETKISNQ